MAVHKSKLETTNTVGTISYDDETKTLDIIITSKNGSSPDAQRRNTFASNKLGFAAYNAAVTGMRAFGNPVKVTQIS
jgi:hypothetical protein